MSHVSLLLLSTWYAASHSLPLFLLLPSLSLALACSAPLSLLPLDLFVSLLSSATAISFYRSLRHSVPRRAQPRHAAPGNNIVPAGSNGGNVWPTLRAKGGQTSPEDAKGEQAEPLCHAVFTERLLCFLYRLLLFSCVERLPPPIITTFAPTGADLSSRFAEGTQFNVGRHARKRSWLLLSTLLALDAVAIIKARRENVHFWLRSNQLEDIRFFLLFLQIIFDFIVLYLYACISHKNAFFDESMFLRDTRQVVNVPRNYIITSRRCRC